MNAAATTEFRSGEEVRYDLRGPKRWILSHLLRYPWLPALAALFAVLNNIGYSGWQYAIGKTFGVLSSPGWTDRELVASVLVIAGAGILQGLGGLGRNFSFEFLAQKIERDARAELYTRLLGKSQAFHSRQRVGDIMARATNDVHFLNLMFSPGIALIFDSILTTAVPLVFIATIDLRLLLVPVIFIVLLVLTVLDYNRRLNPATDGQRAAFGELNASLADALEGIETVKANLGEPRETARFLEGAGRLRELYVRIARIEGRYWPLLVYAVCWGLGFLHALLLMRAGAITLGDVVSYMLLYSAFRFTTFISIWSFNLFQMGLSAAGRVLETIKAKTDLDENPGGRAARIEGRVEFREVTFSFAGKKDIACGDDVELLEESERELAAAGSGACGEGREGEGGPPATLRRVSFAVEPGQTVAIVGRTGSGKTSLVRLINRIFDADSGRVLVDGVDVRDWNLESLRGQVATIEQDVFLYSRSIAWNIGFGKEGATREEIEAAAKEAQAHDFILGFEKGYDTEVGERGVTLSGGQKQRIAIARAFLVDPRILILDDSTSAVDSRTEDEIQRAMRRAQAGRTTFLITHRLSQIRWADRIIFLRGGEVAAMGTHAELLDGSEDYRRLFARG
ncbi:MAG: ABC transporter ATP-binding protein [Spirochaetaceae bacterium]|nr:ABC transporter ATP-binding protein [Spirochaetaceae bacterium]